MAERILEDRTEHFSSEVPGHCSCCGERFVRVNGSDANIAVQNFRIRKPGDTKTAWSFISCKRQSHLEQTFRAGKPSQQKSFFARMFS